MTELAVLADPPHPGVLGSMADHPGLSATAREQLYVAMLRDVCLAADSSGGTLLVNYRPATAIEGVEDSETALRGHLDDIVPDARYEVQVGESFAGRVGNTVSHLLEQEDVTSVAVFEPSAALVTRQIIDQAAMKLRLNDMVLGHAEDGRIYFAAFSMPVDFEDAYAAPALSTLVERGLEAGASVGFAPLQPIIETAADLAAAMILIDSRRQAALTVPGNLVAALDELPLEVGVATDGQPVLQE